VSRAGWIGAVLAATTSSAAASHCTEVSPVLGHQHCGQFGSRWAHFWSDDMFADFGLVLDRVPVAPIDQTGTVSSSTATAAYHTQLARRTMWAGGPMVSAGIRTEHVVVALQIAGIIALDPPTTSTQVTGFAPMTSSYSGGGEMTGVVGLHTIAGRFDLGAMVAVGIRDLGFPQALPSGFSTCNGGSGKDCVLLPEQDDLVVEPRVTASVWIDPRASVGVVAGLDVVGGGESFAVTLTVHGAPFDGS
jgi:hypothetical protein